MLLLNLLLLCGLLNQPSPADTIDIRYVKAIDFIIDSASFRQSIYAEIPSLNKSLRNSPPYIGEEIVFLDYWPACLPHYKKDSACYYLRRSAEETKDIYYYSSHYYFPIEITAKFDKFNSKNSEAQYLIYFSKPHNNFLIAVVALKREKSNSYNLNTRLGTIVKLLFVYDDNQNIIKVFKYPTIVN